MSKRIIICFLTSCFIMGSLAFAAQSSVTSSARPTLAQQRKDFKARRKQINKLVRQYKKAPTAEQPAIKAQLSELVWQGMEERFAYMKQRIQEERARLDDWEKKIKAEEENILQVKAQHVEDLLTGAAREKHRQAKKRWKKQLKEQRQKNIRK